MAKQNGINVEAAIENEARTGKKHFFGTGGKEADYDMLKYIHRHYQRSDFLSGEMRQDSPIDFGKDIAW